MHTLGGKALALLAYLRLSPTGRGHRAFLADLLWSEVDEERGRASLRQAVLSVRQVCGEGLLIADGKELRIVGELPCDAVRFVAAAATGDHIAAVAAYGGDFFSDFALPGARSFEVWATVERERLRGIYVRAADAGVQQLLDAANARGAAAVALQLVRCDELRERSWRLLLECRMAQGDVAAAGVDAVAMQAVLTANDIVLEPATEALLRRVQRGAAATPDAPVQAFRADLVGRTAAFSALLDAWKLVPAEGRVIRVLSGEAGFGKTRLLEDFAVRLRSLGSRVVSIGARVNDHDIPYALIAQLADALTALTGAAGVSEESARTLVALEPRLRSVFPHQSGDVTMSVDLPLRRATAIADLIAAVTDDRAIALLIDDLHWSDEASLRTLSAALSRVHGARVLVVLAQRQRVIDAAGSEEIALETLNAADVVALIESFATLPDAPWASSLAAAVVQATRGVPLLVMEALTLLTQASLLERSGERWVCHDPEALQTKLATFDVQRERLLQLDDGMLNVLLQVAIAGCAIQDAVLSAASPERDVESPLRRLLIGGWVNRYSDRITTRHDEIGRTVIDAAGTQMDVAQRALLRGLERVASLSDAEWRLAAQLCARFRDTVALNRVLDRWIAADLEGRRLAGWRGAVITLLGDQATPDLVRAVRDQRPLRERVARQTRRFLGAGALATAVCVLAGIWYHRAVTPYALRFVAAPISADYLTTAPMPVVEIVNRDGRRVVDASNVVQLSTRSDRSGGAVVRPMRGVATLRADSGVVRFGSVGVNDAAVGQARIVIDATSDGLRPARAPLLQARETRAQLLSLSALDSGSTVVRAETLFVRAGSAVLVDAELQYTSPWSAAAVMLAGVPTWGDPVTSWQELGPMVTPVRDGRRSVPLSFRAPVKAGRYRLFLVFAAESDAAHIASGTNWAVGLPRWGDGNDIARWGDREAAAARALGRVRTTWVYNNSPAMQPHELAAAAIEIVVR